MNYFDDRVPVDTGGLYVWPTPMPPQFFNDGERGHGLSDDPRD